MRIFASLILFAATAFARTEFWAPAAPPRAHYSVDVQFVPETSRLQGSETIRFRNDTARPIGRLALQWYGDVLKVKANGAGAQRSPGKQSVALFDLPHDLPPGGQIELAIEFGASWALNAKSGGAITSFLSPRLWWGFGTLDDYEVRLAVPQGYAVGTSGLYDSAKGVYRADGVRIFGLFIGKDHQMLEADAGDVRVRAVFTKEGRPCADLLLKTAVDAINFYRERFGSYPHRSLTIVPGADTPMGGYPPASALVVVHGQHRMSEKPADFWRWITAHEVGHMYWGDHVLAQGPDSLSWLMIGLGIHADRDYRRARGITNTGNLESNYINGVMQSRDTTIDVTREQQSAIRWDFNNVVEHGKSTALMNALESVIGVDTFAKLYRRCIREYAGKQLGWREFQRAAEIESGEDLNWFFEDWVRSSENAAYRIASRQCFPAGADLDCRIQVERTGGTRTPVTIAARFEDGSEQRARTERLSQLDELTFRSKSPLKDVVLEPESAVLLIDAPLTQRKLISNIQQMPYTGGGAAALDAYQKARDLKVEDLDSRRKLALMLYDGGYYTEALEMFAQAELSGWHFGALVWQGHVLDLLGRRAEAIARYGEALKVPGTQNWQFSQYNMTIDKSWVEARLKTPFERK